MPAKRAVVVAHFALVLSVAVLLTLVQDYVIAAAFLVIELSMVVVVVSVVRASGRDAEQRRQAGGVSGPRLGRPGDPVPSGRRARRG